MKSNIQIKDSNYVAFSHFRGCAVNNLGLVISEHADELLDNLVYYLLYRLKSEQAARHLLDGIDGIYDRLETNPF